MKYKLQLIQSLSGNEASFYTIRYQNAPDAPVSQMFDSFLREYKDDYEKDLISILSRLKNMGNTNSALDIYFKLDEGLEWDDLVCAMYDVPDKHLRLYCIRISEKIVILGNGGPKPKTIRAWQEDPRLTREVNEMMKYSQIIRTRLKNEDLRISNDSLFLTGNLWLIS